ncbi:undecaprenyl-phosphate galactose phosphotransferase [Paucilactobacillus oligofermentans DSM 15707 = LMG 22743]|uniref:Undecaprenyl-phosphate galactose phosphotransferase n=1 Tax=Paucilactobacillus oligofermentans DSM 15707 = LMG 22743 TaxID=1423778 RepID=A0A0R1RNU4_9LACO|nr:sugar transferase [Paucilactobacillus oligofermentans]KRL55115.1 undecaprenyl-phosphate galactose phosphotransferase [Paucilactobacillus oligofermentans DSM 15707 = LMG 22743]CUS25897.1 Exopolysaccharide biosynthesis transferase [Paucilactobacillus oligofermentans DSM 15707 = LMG 22743]
MLEEKQSLIYLFFKRTVDIILSCLALICLSPVFLVIWGLYAFGSDKGPVIYKQERVGKNGRHFFIYKFRSMIVDADKVLRSDKKLYEKYVKNSYKLEPGEDPRITNFGEWLRKTSMDEMPQFVNVLRGEMSLIGPRPVVEEELQEYGDQIEKFLSVKPGAMGYWQASGRSNIGYPERSEIELYYVDHASFWFDVKILFQNLLSIVKSDGAY